MQKKWFKLLSWITLILAIIVAVFTSSNSFAYWLQILGDEKDINVEVSIGEWINTVKVIVDTNQSDDFESYYIEIELGESIGQDAYDDLPANPNPRTFTGVDHSAYTFDNWYLEDGTIFSPSMSITKNTVIYPSWETALFNYNKASTHYNIAKPASVTYSGDLYIPGWRYKGLEINSVSGMSYLDVDALAIGDGIKSMPYQAFRGTQASSLYLGEGLVTIGSQAFLDAPITGSLTLPSTLVTIDSHAFKGSSFDGTLDLTNATNLVTIGVSSFENVKFIGDLYIGPNVETIGQLAFSSGLFDGTLDLTEAVNLRIIGNQAFNKTLFIGEVYIGSKVEEIRYGAFNSTKITTLNLEDASSLISIGSVAFQNTPLETLIMPINSSLEVISAQSFQNTNLSGYLIIPSTVHTINGVSFSGTKITEFYIPISVTTITGNMFPSNKATIRYEGSSVPPGWAANWNSHNHTVIFDAEP